MRLVLDTDVIVAAIRSPTGASAALLRAARSGKVKLLASVPLFIEYEAVCLRDEHRKAAGLTAPKIQQFLDALASLVEPVTPYYVWRPQLRDPDDEMVLEAAVSGSANVLVTFNVKDYGQAPERFGLEALTPAMTLRKLK